MNRERGGARKRKRVSKGLVAALYDDNKQSAWAVGASSSYGLRYLQQYVSSIS
jgi:hypothetical protein